VFASPSRNTPGTETVSNVHDPVVKFRGLVNVTTTIWPPTSWTASGMRRMRIGLGSTDGLVVGGRVGRADGAVVGTDVGVAVGLVGALVGAAVGGVVGPVGMDVGVAVGTNVGTDVGLAVGAVVGTAVVGVDVGAADGAAVGAVGDTVGCAEGTVVGDTDGRAVGVAVGAAIGANVGDDVGNALGAAVGAVGATVGVAVGARVGATLGSAVGDAVGPAVGDEIGASVGDALGMAVGAGGGSMRTVCCWDPLLPQESTPLHVREIASGQDPVNVALSMDEYRTVPPQSSVAVATVAKSVAPQRTETTGRNTITGGVVSLSAMDCALMLTACGVCAIHSLTRVQSTLGTPTNCMRLGGYTGWTAKAVP
jgi:hypothetical protein